MLVRPLKDSDRCFDVTVQKLLVHDFVHFVFTLWLRLRGCLQVVEKLKDFYRRIFSLLLSLSGLFDVRECGSIVNLLLSLELGQAIF